MLCKENKIFSAQAFFKRYKSMPTIIIKFAPLIVPFANPCYDRTLSLCIYIADCLSLCLYFCYLVHRS